MYVCCLFATFGVQLFGILSVSSNASVFTVVSIDNVLLFSCLHIALACVYVCVRVRYNLGCKPRLRYVCAFNKTAQSKARNVKADELIRQLT